MLNKKPKPLLHPPLHDQVLKSGTRPNTQALLMYSIYRLVAKYLFLVIILKLANYKNN